MRVDIRRLGLFALTALGLVMARATHAEGDQTLDGGQLYLAKGCVACHGADGNTTPLPIYPKLGGQNADYTYNQLMDIKSGARSNGQSVVMMGMMAGVTEEEARAMSEWLATQ